MATIPGIIWVLVGVLIAGTSAYLGGLMPFLIIGVGFISFGGYKILINYKTKLIESTKEYKNKLLKNSAATADPQLKLKQTSAIDAENKYNLLPFFIKKHIKH